MNQKLGSTAREEIRKAMTGLGRGAAASAEAERQAELHGVTKTYVYDLTRDVREDGSKPPRKKRSDAGKRKFELKPGTDVWEAASLVVAKGAQLDPDQAWLTAKVNGHTDLPCLGHFQKMLRENQVGRKQRREGRRNHRRWEAKAPLDIVQIDSSALKVRWLDYKSRRIIRLEGIDKNHPHSDPQQLRVWQMVAIDDHTRRRYVRYLGAHHITSADMVRFFCDLCCEWGVPKMIYSDNGPEFQRFFAQAVKIIERLPAIVETGGFEHRTHAPGNAQASGKVEVSHQRVEKMNKYIGAAEQHGLEVTLDHLDEFALRIDKYDNEIKIHRSTGLTPLAKWHASRISPRMLPADYIRAALLFSERDNCTIADDMTVIVDKIKYRLPVKNEQTGEYSGLRAGMKVRIVVPHELEEIFVTLADNSEIAVPKKWATVDVAGEYRTAAENRGTELTKALQEHHKQRTRAAKDLKKQTGETFQVPFYNHEIETPKTGVLHFPHPQISITAEDLATVSPVPIEEVSTEQTPATGAPRRDGVAYVGRPVTFWDAFADYNGRFETKAACKDFLLDLFPNQEGTLPVTEIEAAIDSFFNPQKEAAQLRIAS